MGTWLPRFSVLCITILLLIALLRKWRQSYLVGYILAGVVMGPGLLGLFAPGEGSAVLGEVGILLLMLFLGLEIDIPDNKTALWRPVAGQSAKMILAILFAWIAGIWLGWHWENRLMLSIFLIFNSTAVVSEYMRRTGELESDSGKLVLNILLLQDILVAPVFIFFQWMGRPSAQWGYNSSFGCRRCGALFSALRYQKPGSLVLGGMEDTEKRS